MFGYVFKVIIFHKKKKAVMLSHRMFVANIASLDLAEFGLAKDDFHMS